MFQLRLMGGEKFNITKDEVNILSGKTGLVFILSLNGFINISSISSILPIEVANTDKKKTKDGQWCSRKFGQWYNDNTGALLAPEYQRELDGCLSGGSAAQLEEPSSFAKKLADKF